MSKHSGLFLTALCSILVGVGSFLYGYDSGIIGSIIALPDFKTHFPDSSSSAVTGGIVACLQAGAWVSNFLIVAMMDRFGRRWTIAVGNISCILGGALMTGALNTGMLMAGRFFAGLGLGSMMISCSIYQAEISSAKYRGFMVGMMQLSQSVGFLAATWVVYGFKNLGNNASWRGPFGIQVGPPFILLVVLPFLPESPRWLITKGRDEQALTNYKKFSDSDKVEEEFSVMRANILLEESVKVTSLTMLFSKAAWRRRIYLASYTWAFVAFSGINAINYYQTTMYKALGFNTSTQLLLSGLYATVGLISVFITVTFIIDRVGRIRLFGPVCILLSAYLFASGALQAVYPATATVVNQSAQRAGVALLFMFTWTYSLVSPITFIYISELWPSNIRSLGSSVAGVVHWSLNVMFSQVTPIGLAQVGWRYYFVFGTLNLVSAALFFFVFPETKGRSLEDMATIFGDNIVAQDEDPVEVLRAVKQAQNGQDKEEVSEVEDSKKASSV